MPRNALTGVVLVAVLTALAACSSDRGSNGRPPIAPGVSSAAQPANPDLGSPRWDAWVDRSLGIKPAPNGPQPGTAAWDVEVQRRLGTEAPRARLGTPQWRSTVDALLRTRNARHPVHALH